MTSRSERKRDPAEGAQKLIVGSHGAEASSEKELTPMVRLAGSGTCLAAGARSLARFPSGPFTTVGLNRGDRNPRDLSPGYVV